MTDVVFIYGTLLRGLERAHLLEQAEFLGPATAPGRLHALGAYPGLLEGSGTVVGELYRIDEQTRAQLDRVEGFDPANPDDSLYQRRPIHARLIATGETLNAQTYLYNLDVPEGSHIRQGDYRRLILETSEETPWVIAYGSNMSSARLSDRVGDIQEVRAGFLPQVKLTFNKRAFNGGVYANLAVGTAEDRCAVVAYRLTPEQIQSLDVHEGHPRTTCAPSCRFSIDARGASALALSIWPIPNGWLMRRCRPGATCAISTRVMPSTVSRRQPCLGPRTQAECDRACPSGRV